jgi:ubiquinone/menaquinone biosynthesis C-methylase UbiE
VYRSRLFAGRIGPGSPCPLPTRTLSHDEARRFYDRFGARQDAQAWYEDAALRVLLAHGGFREAGAVVELGCGTGRVAERLLAGELPAGTRYLGIDASATMVGLARTRLARFGPRATVRQSDGTLRIDAPDASFDRFLSTYVLDLLSEDDVRIAFGEARRLLVPGGLLVVAGLTPGTTPLTCLTTALWRGLHRLRPALLGGCRPLEAQRLLDPAAWEVRHRTVVARFGIASEALVAARV